MTCIFVRRNAAWVSPIAALGLFAALAGVAPAQQLGDTCNDRPIVGCGKAHAMIRDAEERFEEDFPIAREAMDDTDVLSYALDIEISNFNVAADTCTIAGTNTITIKSKSPSLTQFTFRLRSQYAITSALINGSIPVTVANPTTTTRIATLDRAYGFDEVFTLTIAYNGTSASRGFGSIDIGTNSSGATVVATLSEAYFAYTWWPVKDGDTFVPGDNSDKAQLDLKFTVPNTMVVASNGLEAEPPVNLSGNRKRYHWASGYPTATYLVSFGATNYNTWTLNYNYTGGSMPVQFFIYPGSDSPANRTAWGKCVDMLATYADVYGLYPFINEKYGIYQFNFGGGMEHQTMTGQGTFSESVTAHELGHQWWGDMITCRTWSDIWLNEGFATYSECLWEERKTGSINSSAYFSAVQARKPSAVNDTVYVSAAGTADMNRIFSSTFTYNKGAWVLHMLRGAVGDATFFQILADYRAAFSYSAASTDDFAVVASATCGQDLSAFFSQWVYSPGAPTYQYGWQSVNVAGQNYLLARIAQTHTTAGYPNVFEMPVRLQVTIGGLPQTLIVNNNDRTEWFVVPVSGPVTALAFDPDQWILRTSATSVAYVAGPPKIVAVSPAPGSSTEASPSMNQIAVTFHTGVNCSASDFTLVGANTGPKSFTLASGANVNPAVLNLDAPLVADNYTLTVTTGVTAANSGQALDGEITDPNSPASLPSGDGVAGGNAVLQFEITPVPPTDGDIDQNGIINAIDLQLLIDVLLGVDTVPSHVAATDINHNGFADGDDIQAFVSIYPGF